MKERVKVLEEKLKLEPMRPDDDYDYIFEDERPTGWDETPTYEKKVGSVIFQFTEGTFEDEEHYRLIIYSRENGVRVYQEY